MADDSNSSGNTLLAILVGGLLVVVVVFFALGGFNGNPATDQAEGDVTIFEDDPDVSVELPDIRITEENEGNNQGNTPN
jgi:hypothetical protein